MANREGVSLLVCAMVLIAGCAKGGAGGGPGTGPLDSQMSAHPVEDLPSHVTVVNASDPRIASVTPIQRLLEQADQIHHGYTADVELNRSTHERLLDVFERLPTYDRFETPTTVPESGPASVEIYVRYNGTVYRIWLGAFYLA
jgi:hypothetical protein